MNPLLMLAESTGGGGTFDITGALDMGTKFFQFILKIILDNPILSVGLVVGIGTMVAARIFRTAKSAGK